MFDEQKVKEAREFVEKYEKFVKEKEAEESWEMYEKAGCHKCYNGQIYSGGRDELSVTYYDRCECSRKPTKKYKKFMEGRDNMLVKDYEKISAKFYDNNSHIKVGSNATDRSW